MGIKRWLSGVATQEEIAGRIASLASDAHKQSGGLAMITLDPDAVRQPPARGALPILLLRYHVRMEPVALDAQHVSRDYEFVEEVVLDPPSASSLLGRQLERCRRVSTAVRQRFEYFQSLGYPVSIAELEDHVPFPGAY